jgi:hypothetical protein
MSYTKLTKYEINYKEDLLLEYLNHQHQAYKLEDFLDVNDNTAEYERIFNMTIE